MTGKRLAIALLGLLAAALAFVFWLGMTGGGTSTAAGTEMSSERPDGAPSTEPAGAAATDGGALETTIHDRRVRDELRRRILAGWATGGGETGAAAREGKVPPMPVSPGGGPDPAYIQDVVRSDFVPMAEKCYEELLSRQDAGGHVVMRFKIVGDEDVGGIVEEADIDADGGVGDERMTTCMRESLLSLAFRPPPHGRGWVTVSYPLDLSPGEPADD